MLLMTEASAFAMTFMEPEEIMQATFDDGNRCVRGETFMRVTDLDGTKLVFIVHDEKSWRTNYVTLESADGKAVYCKFPAGRRVSVQEIYTEDSERVFWLAEAWTVLSNEFSRSFCLIGRYGDTYVPYVTLDDLRAAGLVGHEVRWTVEDDEIVVQGWERTWDEELVSNGVKYVQTDEVTLFWDEEAQWIGIRREVGTPFVDVEDTWFYTDKDGATYYLRGTCMGRAWIGGRVFKVDPDGKTICLLYRYADYPQCPYSIYNGDNFVHPGSKIEGGLLYENREVNPSALALYEGFLHDEMAEAVANRRANERRHREASASPPPQFCGSDGEFDYYVLSVHKPDEPGVYYVDVRRSDDIKYRYVFSYNSPFKAYSYTYSYLYYPGSRKGILDSGLTSENKLANDILYVALHWGK